MMMELLLPSYLIDHFKIVKIDAISSKVHIYLEENNDIPSGYKKEELVSHGFYKEIQIKDFPIRAKQVLFHVKRRYWKDKTTSQIISKDWNLVAKGTRMTVDFAFFKGLNLSYPTKH